MICSTILPWVVERAKYAALPLDGSDVAPFVTVAKGTGIRQVVFLRRPAMFFADDVIYFTAKESIGLCNQAILTQKTSPLGYTPAQ